MFEQVGSLIGGAVAIAPPKDNYPFQMKANEAGVAGQACKFDAGKLTKTGNADKNAAVICMEAETATSAGPLVRGYWITPGMVFKAPCTNKAGAAGTKHATTLLGATVTVNDLGTGVDWATDNSAVAGPLTIVKLDTAKAIAWVVFNTSAVSLDINT
jgi:hypothetical protein